MLTTRNSQLATRTTRPKYYFLLKGTVIKSTGAWYRVKVADGEVFDCRIIGKFRLDGKKLTNPVAVGDTVNFEMEADNKGIIKGIEDRKTTLCGHLHVKNTTCI